MEDVVEQSSENIRKEWESVMTKHENLRKILEKNSKNGKICVQVRILNEVTALNRSNKD